jgi:phospholipid-binding lipoprotein MlaA|tara:strand:+ start:3617 stop:4387 length:771 start_codon:yes stop_codon:yes gene_type:complete
MYIYLKKLISFSLLILLIGCATGTNPNDPYENFNRGVYQFNDTLDTTILKPVATGYKTVAPVFAQKGIDNFFNNIRDFVTTINDVLQLELNNALYDGGRVAINSTVGLLGFIDVHSMSGGERRKEDFGTTLASYGWQESNYIVLPFLGPSSLRDGTGTAVDALFIDPLGYVNDVRLRNQLLVLKIIDSRASLLDATNILDEASLDPYTFQRDAYIQYRNSLINDEDTLINYNDYLDFVDLEVNENSISTEKVSSIN